jgi:pyrimidine operon attenuation protein/uracil phosphoribosyltransferase
MSRRYVEGRVLMDAPRLARTLARLARQIVTRHPDPRELVLVGVRTRGVPLARRLARLLQPLAGAEVPVGALDITLYRDDFTSVATQPILKGTDIRFSIDGRTVLLTDDVLFTGRTVRAALDELIDFGRPARIELAVVVDRGHRELPIRADYVGQAVTTLRDDVVQVELAEQDGADRVVVLEPARRAGEQRAAARRAAKRGGRRRAK